MPLNRNLSKRYFSTIEPQIEVLIEELSPSFIQSNDDAYRGEVSLGFDETVEYSCYRRNFGDSVVKHKLIYSESKLRTMGKDFVVILQEELDENWTCQIFKFLPDY